MPELYINAYWISWQKSTVSTLITDTLAASPLRQALTDNIGNHRVIDKCNSLVYAVFSKQPTVPLWLRSVVCLLKCLTVFVMIAETLVVRGLLLCHWYPKHVLFMCIVIITSQWCCSDEATAPSWHGQRKGKRSVSL